MYAFFWGCSIPAKYPFIEKATRLVLDRLEVPYKDVDNFTCCPEKTLVENLDPCLWKVAAARNVAVAERQEMGILTACTGCYSTLKSVSSHLRVYTEDLNFVNEHLKAVGLEYTGSIHGKIKHIIQYFHDDLGLTKLRQALVKSFKGMRLAVHGGCHLVRPSRAIHFDDPIRPVKFDHLVEALGAKSLAYKTKMLCCGGSLDRVDQSERALEVARVKLRELKRLGADAITTTCPECFKVYDSNQFFLQRRHKEHYGIPVITYQQLLGLALGFDVGELGFDQHKVGLERFLEKFERLNRDEG
jgi:CoB--CoM heterodisulfide reductase subunit B